MHPSDEQKSIIESIKYHNVIVSAVAGSGKTSTIIQMAKEYPSKQIMVITYNNKLKLETRLRVKKEALMESVDVHSYHSFCVKFYYSECYTDLELLKIVLNNDRHLKERIHFDILVIDEAQDMTPIYYSGINLSHY